MKALIASIAVILLFTFMMVYQADTNRYMLEREALQSNVQSLSEAIFLNAYDEELLSIGRYQTNLTNDEIKNLLDQFVRLDTNGDRIRDYSIYIMDNEHIHLFKKTGLATSVVATEEELEKLQPIIFGEIPKYRPRNIGVVVQLDWKFNGGKIRDALFPDQLRNIVRSSSTVLWIPTNK